MTDPAYERRDYALADALDHETVRGRPSGYQVHPIMQRLDELGWEIVKKQDDPPPARIEAPADWFDHETRAGEK